MRFYFWVHERQVQKRYLDRSDGPVSPSLHPQTLLFRSKTYHVSKKFCPLNNNLLFYAKEKNQKTFLTRKNRNLLSPRNFLIFESAHSVTKQNTVNALIIWKSRDNFNSEVLLTYINYFHHKLFFPFEFNLRNFCISIYFFAY